MAKYTTADQIDLPALAQRYELGRVRLTPLVGGAANSRFRLSCASGKFVLTILDSHDWSSAQRLAAHTHAVFRLGVPTTEVVPAVGGALITQLGDRPVILKKWIPGEVRQPLPVPHLPEAGRILARLHALSLRSLGCGDIPVGARRLSSNHMAEIPRFADGDFAAWLTDWLDRVRAVEAENERPSRVVHGDLLVDNVIVREDGRLSVLDWETISLDDPLLDLGMAAVGLAQDGGVLAPRRLDALLAGFGDVAPLSDDDAAALPMEIVHAALIIAFHRYYRHNVRFPDPPGAPSTGRWSGSWTRWRRRLHCLADKRCDRARRSLICFMLRRPVWPGEPSSASTARASLRERGPSGAEACGLRLTATKSTRPLGVSVGG
ncbi:phosphotransferase [Streptomyces antimycoticus]|uniref:phosphotransferase n=1 Tax=Streptomyces antimycoticus TaxID=68175 RepID=UPI003865C278|nr:phosphotransferase [Streptomyces antimycoticus]